MVISIITPSYNQSAYLESCIKSVVQNGYNQIEYIVVDGGSTDDSKKILKKWDSKIDYWVSEPDNGQTHAINKGFRKATGDLIAWMNSDDTYEEGVFERVTSLAKSNPEIDVFYGDKNHIDEKGNIIGIQRYVPYSLNTIANEKMVMCNQACFWRKSVFDRIGYLDETIQFVMDLEFFVRMGSSKKLRFLHSPEIWGNQRYYQGTKTSDDKWISIWRSEQKEVFEKYGLKRSASRKLWSKMYRAAYHFRTNNIKYIFNKFA